MTEHVPFDPYAMFEALERHRVGYVVIGGFARVVHGSGEITRGLDIVPSLREDNLRWLAHACDELDATDRGAAALTPDTLSDEELTAVADRRRHPDRRTDAVGHPWLRRHPHPLKTARTSDAASAPASPPPSTSSACSKRVRAHRTSNAYNVPAG